MAQASPADMLVDLTDLETSIGAARTSFEVSELAAQVLVGIAGFSKVSADHLGTLAASQHDGRLSVSVNHLEGIARRLESPWVVGFQPDSFKGVTEAIHHGARTVHEGLEAQRHTMEAVARDALAESQCLNRTLGDVAGCLREAIECLRHLHRTGERVAERLECIGADLARLVEAERHEEERSHAGDAPKGRAAPHHAKK